VHNSVSYPTVSVVKRLRAEKVLLVDESMTSDGARHLFWVPNPAASKIFLLWANHFDPQSAKPLWKQLAGPEWKMTDLDFTGHNQASFARFSPSGRWLGIARSDQVIEVWDWQKRQKITKQKLGGLISSLAFTADETTLLIADNTDLHFVPLDDKGIKKSLSMKWGQCLSIAIHPDCQSLALSYDGMLGLLALLPPALRLFGIGGLFQSQSSNLFHDPATMRVLSELSKRATPGPRNFFFCKFIERQTEGGFWFSMLR